jgi:hypothetical protein
MEKDEGKAAGGGRAVRSATDVLRYPGRPRPCRRTHDGMPILAESLGLDGPPGR